MGDRIKSINGKRYTDNCEMLIALSNYVGDQLVLETMDGRSLVLHRK